MTRTKSVCIIGAGPSGIVAAKTLLHSSPSTRVTLFDAHPSIGGLWPITPSDSNRQVHPLMVVNQSKHTVSFSDQAWGEDAPQFPLAWQVGQYLQRYVDRYLKNDERFEMRLGEKVERAEPVGEGWEVEAGGEKRVFDRVVIASGFFGKPIVPESLKVEGKEVPVVHSCEYRNLKGLLGKGKSGGGKILVVGGQMSGVEIAGTIGAHLSAAANSPDPSDIQDIDRYSVHHVIQRPIWILPLFTTPDPVAPAAPFIPLDLSAYNLNNRPSPLVNTQGHITEDAAKTTHGLYQAVLGTDQSVFSDLLCVPEGEKTKQAYLAVSDWYCDFIRSGLITLSNGKVTSLNGTTATLSNDGEDIKDIAAVVLATGFDPSACLDFLPENILKTLNHSPSHIDQPVALAFHGTHHPSIPNLGFVGFYRSPYWGVMQMQARFLATYWSDNHPPTLTSKLADDKSIERTISLRTDPRVSQFPMGDYPFLVQEFSEALDIPLSPPMTDDLPSLPHNKLPIDFLTAARYPNDPSCSEAAKFRQDSYNTILQCLTTPRFVARATFRSLLGTWKLERDLESKLPSHPSGHFSGTAKFLLREQTTEGMQCVTNGADDPTTYEGGLEYLYIEEGEFKTSLGFGFKATRRYIYRYDEKRDVLSVWFTKPTDESRADYLFHEIEFSQPEDRSLGWEAKAGHLCIDDFYDVKYNFKFQAVNLKEWSIGYTVKGPKKDYTIRGNYTR